MITIRRVSKSFGDQEIFDEADLQINLEDRYALVGPNGSGKSSLFRMLTGEVEPDGGKLEIKRGVVAGYLPQENAPLSERSVLDETLLDTSIEDGRLRAKAKSVLMGLGFKESDFSRAVSELSGGWAMRVAMARLLIKEPDLLMLDEPTNHLDLDSLNWLREYLQDYPGALFIISHDRDFINKICRAIVSVQESQLKVYHGDYEFFVRERQAEKDRLEAAYQRQQEEIADMKDFIARNRVRHSTAARAQSMIKRLDRLERIELPPEAKTVKIRFPQPIRTGVRVLQLKNVSKSYGETKVYEGLDFELERGWKMAFVGHNGAGKSTLLKMLADVLPIDEGERVLGINVKSGYFSQHRADQLDPRKTVLQEAMDNDRLNPELMVRTVLGTFLFPGDTVFKKTAVLSGGEKSRLALVKLLLDPPNVLLLDEPTTHLDMPSVEALVNALKEFEGTICCITHDIYFIDALADHVVHVDTGKVTVYPGNYEYFQRRQRQQAKERGEDVGRKAGPIVIDKSDKASLKAAAKRQRVRQQDREREAKKVRREITKAEDRLAELATQLSDPELYADYAKVQSIGDEMETLQQELQDKQEQVSRLESDS